MRELKHLLPLAKIKQSFCLVLAMVMLMGTMNVSVFAEEGTEGVLEDVTDALNTEDTAEKTSVMAQAVILTIAAAETEANDTLVTVEGTVTFVESEDKVYIQDTRGGIMVESTGISTGLKLNDEVSVTGVLAEDNNERRLTAATISVIGTAVAPESPEYSIGAITTAFGLENELIEGTLGGVLNVTIKEINDYTFTIVDGNKDELMVYHTPAINGDTSLIKENGTYNISGIITQYGDNYEMKLRDYKDLVLVKEEAIVYETTAKIVNALDDLEEEPADTHLGKPYEKYDITYTLGSDENAMNFAWISYGGSYTPVVEIALASDQVDTEFPATKTTIKATEVTDENGYSMNKATVNGLMEETDYIYRIGDGSNWSDTYAMNVGDADDYSFFVVGDPQIGSSGVAANTEGWKTTMANATEAFGDTDFLLSVGDQVNSANSEEEYVGFFAPEAMQNLPVVTVQGNHDNSSNYLNHYNTPNMSTSAGLTSAGGDTWFMYGDTLYIGLNSNNKTIADHESFLRETVANNPAKWIIVSFHHAIYSSASHSQESGIVNLRQGLTPIFDDLDVDMVLMGHDHCYTRTYQMEGDMPIMEEDLQILEDGSVLNPEGTLYMTLNSGSGSKYYTMKSSPEYYAAVRQQLRVPTISRVEIDDDSLTISTYIADTMALTDTYTIVKDDSQAYIDPKLKRTTTSYIENPLDDVEEDLESGEMDVSSSDIEIVDENNANDMQVVGLRFADLDIPAGATVVDAYIQFTVDEPKKNYGTPDFKIFAVDSEDAPAFEDKAYSVSSKSKTADYVQWTNIPDWTEAQVAGVDQRTSNVASLIQSIIEKDGWSKGNAIAFVIEGEGTRSAESYEGGTASEAAQLIVTYALPEGGSAYIAGGEELIIQEIQDTYAMTYEVSGVKSMNTLDVAIRYDDTIYEVESVLPTNYTPDVINYTAENGILHIVAGYVTPITEATQIALLEITFKQIGLVSDTVEVLYTLEGAKAAAAGINDAVSLEIKAETIGFELTTYQVTTDINDDGIIDISDLSTALEGYMIKTGDADWDKHQDSDVNYDGIIDVMDLTLITHYILGK